MVFRMIERDRDCKYKNPFLKVDEASCQNGECNEQLGNYRTVECSLSTQEVVGSMPVWPTGLSDPAALHLCLTSIGRAQMRSI